jgi:2-succinyl-5-enolpyruvyl-6-hydroxy-3-cyclohexene-1-carboxylate synthase
VATPHGLDFAQVATLYGCGYERPTNLEQLIDAVRRSERSSGTQIIEVRSDRVENLTLHREIADAAIRALKPGR